MNARFGEVFDEVPTPDIDAVRTQLTVGPVKWVLPIAAVLGIGALLVGFWGQQSSGGIELEGPEVCELRPGAGVIFEGAEVGQVDSVTFDQGKAVALLRIDDSAVKEIPSGATFTVRSLNSIVPGNVGVAISAPTTFDNRGPPLVNELSPKHVAVASGYGTLRANRVKASGSMIPVETPLGLYTVLAGVLFFGAVALGLAWKVATSVWLRYLVAIGVLVATAFALCRGAIPLELIRDWCLKFFAIVAALVLLGTPVPSQAQDLSTPMTFVLVIDVSGSMVDRPLPLQARLSDATKLEDVKRRLGLLADHLPNNTRVIVTKFDHESQFVCDETLVSDEARAKLRSAFATITSRDGSTHLWRTADAQLALAKKLAEANPEGRVRVLLYTDGEDMERAPGLDHNTIIKKYGSTLQSVVALDWITLGYDLKADVKSALEGTGVRFTRADKAEDIVPVQAAFTLSATRVLVGTEVRLVDESVGIDIVRRAVQWGDGSSTEEGDTLSHRFERPGRYRVRYAIKSSNGQVSQCSDSVVVSLPVAPSADFSVTARELRIGESLTAKYASPAQNITLLWTLDGMRVGNKGEVLLRLDTPGKHTIELTVADAYGQTASSRKLVTAQKPLSPVAGFRLQPEIATVGQVVTAINESTDTACRYLWELPSGESTSEKHPSFIVDRYGDQVAKLTVWDQFGQSHSRTQNLSVPRPGKPVVDFLIPTDVVPGKPVTFVDRSSGEIEGTGKWYVDGVLIGDGRDASFTPVAPRRHVVKRIVMGPGGAAELSRDLIVPAIDPPSASFVIGDRTPLVGDEIVITDTSRGDVERVVFEWAGANEPVVLVPGEGDERFFTFECNKVCTLTIVQRVIGPGGESRSAQSVNILPRNIQPRAEFQVERGRGGDTTAVHFRNASVGTIEKMEFDPGDGSAPKLVVGSTDFFHEYPPGDWVAQVIVFGPDGFPPSRWTSKQMSFAAPLPAWVWRLWWQVPLGLLALFAIGRFAKRVSNRRLAVQRAMLAGQLAVRPAKKPIKVEHFDFEGVATEELVSVAAEDQIRVVSNIDHDTHLVRYHVHLIRNGSPMASIEAEDGVEVKLGDYLVQYAA